MKVIKCDPMLRDDCSIAKILEHYCAGLCFQVHFAVGIDRVCSPDRRIYSVRCWVDPDLVLCTSDVFCAVDPFWDEYGVIYLRSLVGVLHLDVVKRYCQVDPCSSDGTSVVGSCQIPLPSGFNQRKAKRVPLEKLDVRGMKEVGEITITMEMKEFQFSDSGEMEFSL